MLDLKDKPVGDIMTPMQDVFTMSADTVLDEKTMDNILSAGYSRIPIYEPGNENNFIGMLLVKILITYDPEDCKKVGEFALATLPETRPETSCLDIVNFFQEGKSHMVLVSEFPGEDHGATGVVTLEDVIEELIGEEIIDESDVYIDVHKAIRRLAPAPTYKRASKGQIVEHDDQLKPNQTLIDFSENSTNPSDTRKRQASLDEARRSSYSTASHAPGTSPKASFTLRRSSSAAENTIVRGNVADMREHLKHLGPSNLASRPKQTRYATVKIKPGHGPTLGGENMLTPSKPRNSSVSEELYKDEPNTPKCAERGPHGGEGEGLLSNAGRAAADGVQALHQGYGSFPKMGEEPEVKNKAQQVNFDGPSESLKNKGNYLEVPAREDEALSSGQITPEDGLRKKRGVARSGSITENIVDSNGVRKVVLQTTSSSDEERENDKKDDAKNKESGVEEESGEEADKATSLKSVGGGTGGSVKKKKKTRKRAKSNRSDAGPS